MLMLGGDLKRKEMISARLSGDVLSHLYLASATLALRGSGAAWSLTCRSCSMRWSATST